MDKRPFFSVVIPCYNSHKTIVRLLDSLTHQDINKDDLEVIIVDDYSDYLWYFNILKLFSNLLNIKFIRIEDHNIGYPGPVRELGVLEAIGQYLFFIDHDDRLENSALHELMNLLSEYKYPEVLFTKIKRINDKPEYRKIPLNINIADEDIIDPKNLNSINYNRHSLLHGVFFNIDKFWKKYDIHFRKDLKTNEDVYILNTTKCILNHINKQPIYGDICTYVWYKNPESLSQTLYTQDNEKYDYLSLNFKDYIEASSGVFKKYYIKKYIDKNIAISTLLHLLLYEYFYMQNLLFSKKKSAINDSIIRKNINLCKEEYKNYKYLFDLKYQDVIADIEKDNGNFYIETLKNVGCQCIPSYTIYDWFHMLDK